MKIPERIRKQSSTATWTNGLIGIMPCRNPSHGMRYGTWRHFGSAFSSDQCTISCPQTQTWYGGERKRTPFVHYAKAGRQTTEHVLSSCKIDGCDDWDVSADLPEWDSHTSIIKETRLGPDIVIHSASTQQLIIVELTVPYENRMEEAHIYKREKYMNLTKELENAGYKAVVMPVEVGARNSQGHQSTTF